MEESPSAREGVPVPGSACCTPAFKGLKFSHSRGGLGARFNLPSQNQPQRREAISML
jgi:hypothetical protein